MVGGVGDRQVAVLVEAIREHVVEHATVFAADHAVLSATGKHTACLDTEGDRRYVVGQHALQQRKRPRAARFDLAHVRDVEDPACVANGEMLAGHAVVLHRHLEARELHHLGPGVAMALEQRRAREQGPLLGGAHRAWQASSGAAGYAASC